jgi:hypothetical protein
MNLTNLLTATAKFVAVAGVSFYVGYFLVEGSLSFVAAMGLYAALFWAASEFKQRGLMSVTAVAAALAVALFGLTSGCTLKASFDSFRANGEKWTVDMDQTAAKVVAVCVDDDCSRRSITPVELSYSSQVVPVFPSPSVTRIAIRTSSLQKIVLFDIAGDKMQDRRYSLRLEMEDGSVVTKRVRPKRRYPNGKRCDSNLSYSFHI